MSTDINMDLRGGDEPFINVDFYRKIVKTYLELNRYKTAQYWAEKVVALSREKEQDVYWLAVALFSSKEFHRAAHFIKSRNLHQTNVQCSYLMASCLSVAKEYNEAMEVLADAAVMVDEENMTILNPDLTTTDRNVENVKLLGNSLLSSIHLERGKVFEAMDNRDLAAACFTDALRADVYCYEAFELLVQHQMLSADQEAKLLSMLPFNKHCPTQVDQDLIKYLYESKLNKYRSINTIEIMAPTWLATRLEASLDQKVSDAERHYYNCNFKQCNKISKEIMAKDPYHMGCLPIHISCLVEEKDSNELFLLAHRLVDIYPESGISWFAVGCYYYVIGKREPARRFLGKSTVLDKLFGPAWLAYGHSFAADSERDQAMAAYFKAAQLMVGCHLPLLYIGLENGLTNNIELAEKFFLQAHEIAPNDPFVLHEMGVIAFQSGEYEKAKNFMEEALSKVKINNRCVIQKKWEPLLNNLGHVYRKLTLYEKAIECHMQAMLLMPNCHSTYAAMGFCEVLTGQTMKAVESFHRALSLKRDDTFSSTMLTYVLDLHIQEAKDTSDVELDLSTISQTQVSDKNMTEEDEAALQLIGQYDAGLMAGSDMQMQTSSMRTDDSTTSPSESKLAVN